MFSLQAWDFCTWVERYNNLYKLRLKQLEGAVSGVKFCFDLAVLRRKGPKTFGNKTEFDTFPSQSSIQKTANQRLQSSWGAAREEASRRWSEVPKSSMDGPAAMGMAAMMGGPLLLGSAVAINEGIHFYKSLG